MKWIRLSTCALLAAALAASAGVPAAHAAKKKLRDAFKPAPTTAKPPAAKPQTPPATPPAPDSTRRAAPAPITPPGRTTIAPFPVPGDTGRDAAERRKILNVPKPGMTTLVPAPGAVVPPGKQPIVTPGDTSALPKFGDYVYVEELPEAIIRVSPSYPEPARQKGVQGTVMVQALVARDGAVADTRVVKSIPLLDDAAMAAVRQWRFKPAMAHDGPVAVWVAVPVKFSLH